MIRLAALMMLVMSVTGCGLTETVGAAATDATAKAQELKEAKAAETRAKIGLDQAASAAAAQREEGEKATQ
jgi:hypothetical protein